MSLLSWFVRRLYLRERHDENLTIHDLEYFKGTDAHVNHKLDIFLPKPSTPGSEPLTTADENQSNRKIPIVIHVHGGGWVRGSRKNEWRGGPSVGRSCSKEGLVGVIVSYRLAKVSPASFFAWSMIFGLIILLISILLRSWQLFTGYIGFMTLIYCYTFFIRARQSVNLEHMVDDLCRAIIYVRENIQEHYSDADPDRIFLSGHSAGAHLISLLVLDKSYFEKYNLPPTIIRGVITISGIYTLSNPVHDSKNHPNNWIFRILYSSNLLYPQGKQMHEFSPIEFIKDDEQLPPFLVMSAKFDMGLEIDAKRFVDRFRQYNHAVDYHVIRGTTHGTIASKFSKHDAQQHFFQFIRQHMN